MEMKRLFLVGCLTLNSAFQALAQDKTEVEAIPRTLPQPSYPPMAAFFGMSGYCEVRFAVDLEGYAFNLATSCTDYVFCYQSKKAVNRATFEPAYEKGRPKLRDNVVYPLEYVMDGVDPTYIDRARLKPCREIVTS